MKVSLVRQKIDKEETVNVRQKIDKEETVNDLNNLSSFSRRGE